MILVILVIGILMLAFGTRLYYTLDCDKEDIGTAVQIAGGAVILISTVASFILLISVLDRVNIDKKIALYEEENNRIEQQIADVVTQYQEYETGIFTEVSTEGSITLVQSQIEVYVDNNKTIRELKSSAINAYVYRWWLYFGK